MTFREFDSAIAAYKSANGISDPSPLSRSDVKELQELMGSMPLSFRRKRTKSGGT